MVKVTHVDVWRPIELGIYSSASEIINALNKSEVEVYPGSFQMMWKWTHGGHREKEWDRFVLLPKAVEVDLFNVSPREIGLGASEYVSYVELVDALKKQGFLCCPQETGPLLRLCYAEQPLGEKLIVISEKLSNELADPCIFTVGCSHKSQRYLGWSFVSTRYSLDTRFIVTR